MKRKPIPVDWDELEAAFDNKSEDLVYYLDLVTGDVVLEGEGEEGEDDEADLEPAVVRSDGTRLYVVPPGVEEELAWMDAFLEGEGDALAGELRDALHAAVDRESPEGFRDAVRDDAEVKDRWFLFRAERVHEAMEAWLEEHSVQSAQPPPWR